MGSGNIGGVNLVEEALAHSRSGDTERALLVLRNARAQGTLPDSGVALLFTLLAGSALHNERLALCDLALSEAKSTLQRSSWLLRRALLRLETADGRLAVADLQEVIRLAANDEHPTRAKRALMEAAAAIGEGTKKRRR